MRRLLLLLALALGLVLSGCYSFSGSTLPSHLRTLRIRPIENRTLESSLPDRILRGLQDGFRSRSNLRQVNGAADAELFGTVTQYSQSPQSTAGSSVTTWRVDILFKAVFVDRVRGDTLYADGAIPGYAYYKPDAGETEETGRARAIDALVKVVLDNTVSAW
ncbi:MAG TPA: LptE family protein [Fibrobacteria bacterium]|jgi:hypothetical protein|nr:LptE family protein [Fibrobacteria bacterium]